MMMTDCRWFSVGVWVANECLEQPGEPEPLFKCDSPANAATVARIHNDLLVRAQQAEAERDERYTAEQVAAAVRAERDRADHNAGAVNENAAMVVRLRAELAEAKAEADELRRLLLDETYRPEGGEIVMRELAKVKAERDRLRAELAEAKAENERLRGHVNDLCDVRDAALDVKAERDQWRDKATALASSARCAGDLADQYRVERDRLAAQVAAVRALADKVENRMMATAKPSEIRAALDGTEQDEAG